MGMMASHSWTGRQLESLNFENVYLQISPAIPEPYRGYRKKLRKGVYSHMTWAEFMNKCPENGIKTHIRSDLGRLQLSSFLHKIGLSPFAAECPCGVSSLRQALTVLSLDLMSNAIYAEQEQIISFAIKIYNGSFSGDQGDHNFWRSIYYVARLSHDSRRPPSCSPPPYTSISSPS